MNSSEEVTKFLQRWFAGSENEDAKLAPAVYSELRKIAKRYLRTQNPGFSFHTTELVHEAFVKIASSENNEWENRAHFFGVVSHAMRHIVVDHARAKFAQKRGGSHQRVNLDDVIIAAEEHSREILDLDEALTRLESVDKRKCRVVELKFFCGLSNSEVAGTLGVSEVTVKRDWNYARSWLLREIDRSRN